MKKIYIEPETRIFKISIRDGVLENMASQVGQKYESNDIVSTIGDDEDGVYDGEVLSRRSGSSVWDNAW